jgi:hypothetical protein
MSMKRSRFDVDALQATISRRDALCRYAGGIGGLALTSLLADSKLLAADDAPLHIPRSPQRQDLTPKSTHHRPRAKAVISLFMHGGPSHVDLFDPKSALDRYDGEDYPGEVTYSFKNRASKKLLASPWKFSRHGESGVELSELLPHTAGIADRISVIRSMYTGINGHEPSIWSMNTGLARVGRPALGSWITYALGSECADLPAYLVLTDPGGLPVDGVRNWSQGWLPPLYQGTPLRPTAPRILNLDLPAGLRSATRSRQLALLSSLERGFATRVGGDSELEARIASYELAARMQIAAADALDIQSEPEHIKKMYGLDREVTRSYGERCLLARRLVERGVRYVHLLINGQIWDNHENIRSNLAHCCARTDQPSAALVSDLAQRGLLDSTIVLWGGEIGRLPVVENHGQPEKAGRDHNGQGFSMWVAGGGFRGGKTYGETDEFGHRAVVDRVGAGDLHATLLTLLGLDHRKVAYHHHGTVERLVADSKARVLEPLLESPPLPEEGLEGIAAAG